MKINNNSFHNKQIPLEYGKLKRYTPKDYEGNKNNTDFKRPAKAISFCGSALEAGQKAADGIIEKGMMNLGEKIGSHLVESNKLSALLNRVADNETAYNAVCSLVIAGMLKPFFVMMMPGSEDEDKQIVATKNFLQAFVGSFLNYTIGGRFIKKSVDVIKNNLKLAKFDETGKIYAASADDKEALEIAQKMIKKEHNNFKNKFKNASKAANEVQGFAKIKEFYKGFRAKIDYSPSMDEIYERSKEICKNFKDKHFEIFKKHSNFTYDLAKQRTGKNSKSTYYDAYESLWKNSSGLITTIGKAKISSVLLPGVMAFIFAKRNLNKKKKKEAANKILTDNPLFINEKEKFNSIINPAQKSDKNDPSFKGSALDKGIDTFAKGIEHVAMSEPGEKLTKLLAKAKKPSARMADFESVGLTAYWVQNTARSKKIEPGQKLGLNIHTILVTVVSSTAALLIDTFLDSFVDGFSNIYSRKLLKIVDETKEANKGLLENTAQNPLKDLKASSEMAVRKVCNNLIKNNKESSDDIKQAISELQTFKPVMEAIDSGFVLNEEFMGKVIDSLKNTEPVKKTLQEKAKSLSGSKNIVEKFCEIDLLDKDKVNSAVKSLTGDYSKKLSKLKSLTIFTLVVRFLVPVLMVPVSGKLKKKIVEIREKKTKKKSLVNK